MTSILSPFKGILHPVYLGWTSMYIFLPWFAEITLLFRLFAVYPPRRVGRLTIGLILVFPICLKITRLTIVAMFLTKWNRITKDNTDLIGAAKSVWFSAPYTKIEWISQLLDNAYDQYSTVACALLIID